MLCRIERERERLNVFYKKMLISQDFGSNREPNREP